MKKRLSKKDIVFYNWIYWVDHNQTNCIIKDSFKSKRATVHFQEYKQKFNITTRTDEAMDKYIIDAWNYLIDYGRINQT